MSLSNLTALDLVTKIKKGEISSEELVKNYIDQIKTKDKEKMHNILHTALEQIAKISILLNPIIPKATTKVLEALKINSKLRNLSFLDGKNIIGEEIKINKLDILFKKIT